MTKRFPDGIITPVHFQANFANNKLCFLIMANISYGTAAIEYYKVYYIL